MVIEINKSRNCYGRTLIVLATLGLSLRSQGAPVAAQSPPATAQGSSNPAQSSVSPAGAQSSPAAGQGSSSATPGDGKASAADNSNSSSASSSASAPVSVSAPAPAAGDISSRVDPAKKAAIKELLTLTKLSESYSAIRDVMISQVRRTVNVMLQKAISDDTHLNSAQKKQMLDTVSDSSDRIISRYRPLSAERINMPVIMEQVAYKVYDESFTTGEIQDLITFYRTATGQKALKQMPEIMHRSMTLSAQMILSTVMDITKEVVADELAHLKTEAAALAGKTPATATPVISTPAIASPGAPAGSTTSPAASATASPAASATASPAASATASPAASVTTSPVAPSPAAPSSAPGASTTVVPALSSPAASQPPTAAK